MSNSDHFFERIETTAGMDYLLRAGEGVPEKGVYIRPHVHLEHEIMWFKHAAGFFCIGSEKFPVTDGTLVFVSSMTLHDMELAYTADHERYLLQYNDAVIHRLKFSLPAGNHHAGFIMQPDASTGARIQFLFEWLTELHQRVYTQNEVDPVMLLLLNTILSQARFTEPLSVRREKDSTFGNIIDFVVQIERDRDFTLSLIQAAACCRLSPAHFSRTFKKIMHVSFKDYLVRKKLARAADLLRNTRLSVTEIAHQCEFTDSAYFCFRFRKMMGVTPGAFRAASRSTKQLSTRHDPLMQTEG
ncbi:AraC-type DNA-binding protein [Candidatus Pantoea varia]|uniref:AraC-type DNA-binding protein n=1 Tax=Candidatus Pantoea varia TaxID=1881036 RepID=A0A1I5EYN4_9GAMM|nr:AraC family transcriptional regulator [Pantoea varia]SFO16161.1 AraC-type DNA-binding protein [Pantoea varia]